MAKSYQLTDLQVAQIKHLLQEQDEMIELFARHGLLAEAALREKVSTIQQVTRFAISDVLTSPQMELWKAWDVKLDREEAEKHRVRRRMASAP